MAARETIRYVGKIVAHACILIFLSLILLDLPYSYENEVRVISSVSLLKNVVSGLERKPSPDAFLFINTAYQKALVDKVDDVGFVIGNQPITDRKSLSELFRRLSANNAHRYVICDVFLEEPTADDSTLLASVISTRNVIFPYHRINGEFIKPVIAVPSALADYDDDFGGFLKYRYLQYDTCKTIALRAFTDIDDENFHKGLFMATTNRGWFLNSFITEFPIRQFDVFRDDTLGYASLHLGDILRLPDELFYDLTDKRMIVIGDFLDSDMHSTIYGTISGPLIHVNAYLNLHEGKNRVSFWFFAYLLICYVIFSAAMFHPDNFLDRFAWIKHSPVTRFALDYLKYAFFLLLMSIVSYLLFDIHLNILMLSLYISAVENILDYYKKRKLKKTNHENSPVSIAS